MGQAQYMTQKPWKRENPKSQSFLLILQNNNMSWLLMEILSKLTSRKNILDQRFIHSESWENMLFLQPDDTNSKTDPIQLTGFPEEH